jgi:hypothetical protein
VVMPCCLIVLPYEKGDRGFTVAVLILTQCGTYIASQSHLCGAAEPLSPRSSGAAKVRKGSRRDATTHLTIAVACGSSSQQPLESELSVVSSATQQFLILATISLRSRESSWACGI